MNNRINESNLVNLSGDFSALNQLDTKESLALSFPFDHIYACHSVDSQRAQAHLNKEVEISLQPDDKLITGITEDPLSDTHNLSERLNAAEFQNTRLRHLLVYHLDLIQQQNEIITKKDKQNNALKLENDTLKSKVTRMDRRITVSQRHNINPAPVVHTPPPYVSPSLKTKPSPGESQMVFNSLTDFLVPDSRPIPNQYNLNSDITKTKSLTTDPFNLNRPSETDKARAAEAAAVPSTSETSSQQGDNSTTMIENKRSYVKKEIKTEPRSEPLYTVTSNSGNTVIQKIQRTRRRTSGGIGSLSRLPKLPPVKTEPPENVNMFEDDKAFEQTFSVNKKSKMINTYGKSKATTIPKKTLHYTGSLADRLQLIDTTPTGEDPYQLGEADMREQSPIPKLMLQKSNHARLKLCSDQMGESTMPTRRIYDVPESETNKIKLEKRYNLPTIVPYSATRMTTYTSTYTPNTPTATYTHAAECAPVYSPMAAATITSKQSATHIPKYTSTVTTPHVTTPLSTFTPRNSTTRATASSYKATKAVKPPQATPRKSTQPSKKKTTQKTPFTAPYTTIPLMATMAPLDMSPFMTTHTATHSDMFPAFGTPTHTFGEIKKEALDPPLSPTNLFMQQPDLELVKKEADLDWPFSYSSLTTSAGGETSLCDFSYGENSNLTTLPAIDSCDFQQLMDSEAAAAAAVAALENIDSLDYSAVEKMDNDKVEKLEEPIADEFALEEENPDNRQGTSSKRGRKRALSTAGLGKVVKQTVAKGGPKAKAAKGKAASRGKKSSLPGMKTGKAYHTLVGDPDVSWYYGLDPELKFDDIDQGDSKASTVEVPRWREMPISSISGLEGTENLDDKIFEKRHQKLEAEERRQLRWHMRRIREQKHVERLRLRQRDPWCNNSQYQPSVYTIWPQPQRDVRMIEITDSIPVMAFGEDLPDIPPADFMLPWVRTSKPLKRSKRSKTLH